MAALRPAMAEDIVVIGSLLENKPMAHARVECPADAICLRSWWTSVIDVRKSVSGARVSGRVAAAVMQHASLKPSYQASVRLFVLRPIEDPATRARLRVDYYLQSMSAPRQMYCLPGDPKELGLVLDATYVASDEHSKGYCFELPEE